MVDEAFGERMGMKEAGYVKAMGLEMVVGQVKGEEGDRYAG